jgi:hypothetical protein
MSAFRLSLAHARAMVRGRYGGGCSIGSTIAQGEANNGSSAIDELILALQVAP